LIEYHYITKEGPLLDSLLATLATQEYLAMDTECTPNYIQYPYAHVFDPHTSLVRLLQINYLGNKKPYILDAFTLPKKIFKDIFSLPCRKVFFNAGFDIKQIKSFIGFFPVNTHCAMIAMQVLGLASGIKRVREIEGGFSYKIFCNRYFNVHIDKDLSKSNWSGELSDSQLKYAALDVGAYIDGPHSSYLLEGYLMLLNQMKKLGVLGINDDIDQPAVEVAANMEYYGMPVYRPLLNRLLFNLQGERDRLLITLCKQLSLPIHKRLVMGDKGKAKRVSEPTTEAITAINNPNKLKKLLSSLLPSSIELTSTNKEALSKLEAKLIKLVNKKGAGQEQVNNVLTILTNLKEYKDITQKINKSWDKIVHPLTNSIHSRFNVIGTGSGRLSSSKDGGEDGINAQGISKSSSIISLNISEAFAPYILEYEGVEDREVNMKLSFRHIFQAPFGYTWSSVDYSAMELLMAAWISNDDNAKKPFILSQQYEKGEVPNPVSPEGKGYTDPLTDSHIIAASLISPEVMDLLKHQPHLCNKKNPLVAKARDNGKVLNYQLIYGAMGSAIANALSIPVEDGVKMVNNYFSYPNGFYKLKAWLDTTAALGQHLRFTKTLAGRIINVAEANAKGLNDVNTMARRACNMAIQGSGADIIKLVPSYIYPRWNELLEKYKKQLKGRFPYIVNLSHDEVNSVVPGYIGLVFKEDEKGITQFSPCPPSNPSLVIDRYNTTLKEEYEIACHFNQVVQDSMELAEAEYFKKYNNSSDFPPKAECSLAPYWLH